jgi:Family of unknown function (DUF6065)
MDARQEVPSPLITFYRFVPGCRLPRRADRAVGPVPYGASPQRADRAAAVTMPACGFRQSDAVAAASAFGWSLFPPIGFSLLWDGSNVLWTYQGADGWYPLTAVQFPDFAQQFDDAAPAEMAGFSPQFLASLIEPGIVQIWSGLVVRTAPGWSLLVRAPANLPRNPGYECYEGIIESDRWFGPLFTNVRLTRTDAPVEFAADVPFLQVQPVPQSLHGTALDTFEVVPDLAELSAGDWEAYRKTVVQPNTKADRRRARYAAAPRRRRKQPTPA